MLRSSAVGFASSQARNCRFTTLSGVNRQSKPCWTPFPISTIIVSRTGVGPWTLGLGYEASNSANTRRHFSDNKIDADVLPQLTDDDLKDIGVSAVGDRRRLLAAIAALRRNARCVPRCRRRQLTTQES